MLNIQGQLNSALKTKTQLQTKVLDVQGQLNDASEAKIQLLSKVHKARWQPQIRVSMEERFR